MVLPLPSHPLDVENDVSDFAIGLAYTAHLGSEAEALELLGVEAAAWERARAWTDRFVAEVEQGQQALIAAFGVAFKETQARLRGAAEPLTSTPEAAAAPALGPGLLAQLSNEALARPTPAFEAGTAPSSAVNAPVAPPSVEAPAAPISVHASAPPVTFPSNEVEAGRAPRYPTMPFDPRRPSALAETGAAPSPSRSEQDIDLDSTAEAAVLPVRSALPFVNSGEARTPAAPTAAAHELTLEQYASLCAALDAFPDKAPIILERYGITQDHELERLHRSWHARFATDGASNATFQRHLREIRARLGDPR